MSKRQRDEMDMSEESVPLGMRASKRKAIEIQAAEKAKKDASAQKREVSKKLRADVDDLSSLFGKMGQGRRRKHTRKVKKTKKSKKTRKH